MEGVQTNIPALLLQESKSEMSFTPSPERLSSSSSPLLASFLSVTHLLPYWHLDSPINFVCLELCFSVTSERPTPLYQKLQGKISCSSLSPSPNRAFSKNAF